MKEVGCLKTDSSDGIVLQGQLQKKIQQNLSKSKSVLNIELFIKLQIIYLQIDFGNPTGAPLD